MLSIIPLALTQILLGTSRYICSYLQIVFGLYLQPTDKASQSQRPESLVLTVIVGTSPVTRQRLGGQAA